MPHGPRRFAKNAENVRHFRLVARSGHDTGNEGASPLVLEPFVPLKAGREARRNDMDEAELLTIPESLQTLGPSVFGLDRRPDDAHDGCAEKEEEVEHKCPKGHLLYEHLETTYGTCDGCSAVVSSGEHVMNCGECNWYLCDKCTGQDDDEAAALDDDCYFPKDGYNYNKHLKSVGTEKKKMGGIVIDAPKQGLDGVQLAVPNAHTLEFVQPAATTEQEEVMRALTDTACETAEYEEFDDADLEELFPGGVQEEEVMLWGESALERENMPDLALFKEMHAQRMLLMAAGEPGDDDDEPYIEEGECPAGAPITNARFEQLLENEYAEEEEGALDDDEIEGPVNLEDMEAILDDYIDERNAEKKFLDSVVEPQRDGKLDDCPRVIDETKALIERLGYDNLDADPETSEGESEEDESKNWDCETVLSTLSNISNRPGKISKIKLVKKNGPENPNLTAIAEQSSDEEDEEEDIVDLPDVITERPENESAEEKKLRKASVKAMRKICRQMKKESKDTYKNESAKLKATKSRSVGDVKDKLRVMKL